MSNLAERAKNENWTLSNDFIEHYRTKTPFPAKVGERIGEWTILGFWVNRNNLLKAVKVQCSCGTVIKFYSHSALKDQPSTRCRSCYMRYLRKLSKHSRKSLSYEREELIRLYGLLDGEKLWKLWYKRFCVMHSGNLDVRKHLHITWTNYKAFAEYIVQLPNFDKWPEYELDRIDNDIEFGYAPGNVRFVTHKDNMRNTSRVHKIVYRKTEYVFPAFIEMITGIQRISKIHSFMRARLFSDNLTVIEALNKLYFEKSLAYLWPSQEARKHFTLWYNAQVAEQLERRKGKSL